MREAAEQSKCGHGRVQIDSGNPTGAHRDCQSAYQIHPFPPNFNTSFATPEFIAVLDAKSHSTRNFFGLCHYFSVRWQSRFIGSDSNPKRRRRPKQVGILPSHSKIVGRQKKWPAFKPATSIRS
jgi:hypothetical protein